MGEDDRVDAGIDMDGSLGYMPDYLLPQLSRLKPSIYAYELRL